LHVDLYYDQSANAVAAAMTDSGIFTAFSDAASDWAPLVGPLVNGDGDVVTIGQAQVDSAVAFFAALRAAAGTELADVLDRELARIDLPSLLGSTLVGAVARLDRLTCEGFETTLFCGEVTGDCTITATDALFVLRIAVGSLAAVDEADLDGNGSITATDALRALSIAVGLEPQTDACNTN
jgi:hypothetical protein